MPSFGTGCRIRDNPGAAQVAQQEAPGAHAAEALQRRWQALERNADTETEKIRARHRAQDQKLAGDQDLTELARQQRRDQLKAETQHLSSWH